MFRTMSPGWSVCKGGVRSLGVFVTLLALDYLSLLYLALSCVRVAPYVKHEIMLKWRRCGEGYSCRHCGGWISMGGGRRG